MFFDNGGAEIFPELFEEIYKKYSPYPSFDITVKIKNDEETIITPLVSKTNHFFIFGFKKQLYSRTLKTI